MSISSISSGSSSYTNPFAKIGEDFQKIGTALNSGSLSDAQQAYALLKSDPSSQAGSATANNPMAKDIESLGSALQSGSVEDAQQAFGKIQDHLKGTGEFARQQMSMQGAFSSQADSAGDLKQAFEGLGEALQSGSLSDAQKAFATLQQTASAKSSGDAKDPFAKDLAGLGEALSSGNLSDAQKLYTQMQEKMAQGPRPGGPGVPPPQMAQKDAGVKEEFDTLSAALESGDLSGAQKAFAALKEKFSGGSESAAAQSSAAGTGETKESDDESAQLGAAMAAALVKYLRQGAKQNGESGALSAVTYA